MRRKRDKKDILLINLEKEHEIKFHEIIRFSEN